jgi:hypothetical protein
MKEDECVGIIFSLEEDCKEKNNGIFIKIRLKTLLFKQGYGPRLLGVKVFEKYRHFLKDKIISFIKFDNLLCNPSISLSLFAIFHRPRIDFKLVII